MLSVHAGTAVSPADHGHVASLTDKSGVRPGVTGCARLHQKDKEDKVCKGRIYAFLTAFVFNYNNCWFINFLYLT